MNIRTCSKKFMFHRENHTVHVTIKNCTLIKRQIKNFVHIMFVNYNAQRRIIIIERSLEEPSCGVSNYNWGAECMMMTGKT